MEKYNEIMIEKHRKPKKQKDNVQKEEQKIVNSIIRINSAIKKK